MFVLSAFNQFIDQDPSLLDSLCCARNLHLARITRLVSGIHLEGATLLTYLNYCLCLFANDFPKQGFGHGHKLLDGRLQKNGNIVWGLLPVSVKFAIVSITPITPITAFKTAAAMTATATAATHVWLRPDTDLVAVLGSLSRLWRWWWPTAGRSRATHWRLPRPWPHRPARHGTCTHGWPDMALPSALPDLVPPVRLFRA
mmetsp:Transcript_86550/g.171826  ORF Transcript_86550/g.171826 Transcript_86550/m.171826 type:complete len:200 (-) Transcript_86550:447-1046(-)